MQEPHLLAFYYYVDQQAAAVDARRCFAESPARSKMDNNRTTVKHAVIDAADSQAWRGFATGDWQEAIDVRGFVQQNFTPYDGDDGFLERPTERTTQLWNQLSELMKLEREKGVLDVSQIPSSITAHEPGYIDKTHEIIVGLQTEAPLKRAIFPNGGYRMVEGGLKAYGFEPEAKNHEIFTKYRKTHNDGVFDVYTPEIRKARSSHIVTGLPDAYGRGRIIGDYRRVALYGVDRLIDVKKAEKASLDKEHSTESIIRDREELSEQLKALGELKQMAANYGFDISGPATNAKEAVQ
jgi:formate C-acetyltransferase